MEIKVAELMDFYTPAAETGTVSPERVRARTLARLGAARRKRRLRTAVLAAALAALLAVGAAAAKQIGFDELPALLRRCFGIEGAAVTGLRYDRVTEAPDARRCGAKAFTSSIFTSPPSRANSSRIWSGACASAAGKRGRRRR